MCLIGFTFDPSGAQPLVLASNRDEFFSRPTRTAHWWRDLAGVYGGRDESAGGSWLALQTPRAGNGKLRLAALTNFRDGRGAPAQAISRGALVTGVLQSAHSVPDTLNALVPDLDRYAGFSLLVFEWTAGLAAAPAALQLQGWHLSNQGRYRAQVCSIEPGVHALSNASFDEPWPKSTRLIAALQAGTAEPHLLSALTSAAPVAAADLPATGIDAAVEAALSSSFIRPPTTPAPALPDYGTRSSSVVTLSADGAVQFRQWTWDTTVTEARASHQQSMFLQPAQPA